MNSSLHPEIDRIILKSTAYDPKDRYGTCKALIKDLNRYRTQYIKK